jgi:benzoyl-CoA reductase/2-hydroxyglutaryl-CoA dehydratase subunit BcrC/BadD/HgdB
MIKNIAADWYRMDASAAFVFNRAMHDFVKSFLKKNRVDGVVYHVLKGQVEYDFELERFENLFGRQGIPMIRIETDYQYQDVEQLRIRMEAFSEMLERGRGKMMREAL